MLTPRRVVAGLARRVALALDVPPREEPALLEMVWPERLLSAPPAVTVAPGYVLRQYAGADAERYAALMAAAQMDVPRLDYWEHHLLAGGFFVIEHGASGTLVATCMASHHPTPRHPRGGNLGWLAAHPAHGGKALGGAAAAAVTARLIAAGYRRIYLGTHDFRLPAIKLYLKMGWLPLLYQPDMEGRWRRICQDAGWPYTPEEWPR